MATSIIYGLVDEFNKSCTDFRVIANRAATFMNSDNLVRADYINNVEKSLRDYQTQFEMERSNPFKQGVVLNELKSDLDLTKTEYQILRTRDYFTYLITDVFEEHGVIKYGKIALSVVSGSMQVVAGGSLFIAGHKMHIKQFKGVGIMLSAQGLNNVYESVSPLIYESAQAGPLRNVYRKAATLVGLDKDSGDFAYSAMDFSFSVYASIRSPVLQASSKRLIEKSIFEKPGTGRLFRAVNSDYITKWKNKTTPMKFYFTGDTLRKAVMEFPFGGYKKDY